MGNKLRDEDLNLNIIVNGDKGKKELGDLEKSTRELTNRNKELRLEKEKLIRAGKQESEEFKAISKEITANNATLKTNETRMTELRKVIGLTGLTMRQLRSEQTRLKRLMDSSTPGTEQWLKFKKELGAIESQMASVRGGAKQTQTSLGSIAKDLLPAFGIAAIAGLAVKAFDKIINGTKSLQDQWEFAMSAMKNGTDFFWKSLASGEWYDFFENLEKAIKVGYQYAEMMDNVKESTWALSMEEADARDKEIDLEIALRNKLLSKDERIKAGEERIQMEKDLTKKRTDVATEAYNAEMLMAMDRSKLDEKTLINTLKKVDAQTRAKAEAYNLELADYNAYQKEMDKLRAQGSNPEESELYKWKKYRLTNAGDEIKLYAQALRGEGNLTDQMIEKLVGSYVKMKEASVSGKENIKRVITTTNSLLAGEEENGQKISDKAAKERKESSDKAIEDLEKDKNKEMAILADKYTTEGMTDAVFKAEQEKLDAEYLFKKQAALAANGQSTVDIDKQINDKRIQTQKEFNDLMAKAQDEYMKNSEDQPLTTQEAGIDPATMVTPEDLAFAARKHSLDEWVKYLTQKTDEQLKIKANALNLEKEIENARAELVDTQIGGIEQIAGAMAGMFEQGSAAQIAFFAIEKALAIAQVWVNYARESSAIAVTAAEMNAVSFGIAGTAWAAIMQPKALLNAGLNTGIITAQAIAQVASSKKSKASGKGMQAGGYGETGASDSEPAKSRSSIPG